MNSFLFLLFVPGLLRNFVESLRCYECDKSWNKSTYSYACFDPLDTTHDDVKVTECPDARHSCLKVKTIFEDGEVFYKRTCEKYKYKDSCKNFQVNGTRKNETLAVELCWCRTDLCNSAEREPASSTRTTLLTTAVLWGFLRMKVHT